MIKLVEVLEIKNTPKIDVPTTLNLCRIVANLMQSKPDYVNMWRDTFIKFGWNSFESSIRTELERLEKEGKLKDFYDAIMEIYKKLTNVNENG